MASKKKHSEGIALLSVYSDEDDEEMEDAEEEEEEQRNQKEAERTEEGQQEGANFMDEEKKRGEEDSGTPKVVIDGGASSAHATPRSLDNDEPDWSSPMNFESERAVDDTSGESTDTLLDQFLPPRPKDKCSEELQVSSPYWCFKCLMLLNFESICNDSWTRLECCLDHLVLLLIRDSISL